MKTDTANETLQTEISLLDLQESKKAIKAKLDYLKAKGQLYGQARHGAQLKSVQAQIDEWGTKENIQYRIM
mgnify:CR=1 FL=1